METTTSAQYIASDPAICHGEPTFRGTRIMVADILEQDESGMAWEAIIEEWRYEIDRDAIAKTCSHGSRPSMALAKPEGQKVEFKPLWRKDKLFRGKAFSLIKN